MQGRLTIKPAPESKSENSQDRNLQNLHIGRLPIWSQICANSDDLLQFWDPLSMTCIDNHTWPDCCVHLSNSKAVVILKISRFNTELHSM